jgi:dihydrodipicolinate synthase/N-acetylneuraminate lyase
MLLEGIFLPLTSPFHADGRLFQSKLEYNAERYSRTPAAGMLVLSEVGEADGLTDEESRLVLESAIAAAGKEKVMVASVGRESVYATLKLAEVAAAAGYDSIAVRAPSFALDPAMTIELMTYFRAVADAATLPVVLLSAAVRRLTVEVVAELAQHPNVTGAVDDAASTVRVAEIKAATSEVSRETTVTPVFAAATRRMLASTVAASSATLGGVAVLDAHPRPKTRIKRVGFQVLSGSASRMLEAWQAGASGAVPRVGACAPQACCEVWQAFKDGDFPLAEEKQERVRQVSPRMAGLAGIGAIKYGCDFNGYFGGRPRLPLLGLTAAGCAEIEHQLATMRN